MVTVQMLGECDIFRGLPSAAVEGLAELCREHTYSSGYTIVTEGEPADTLYVLVKGMVSLRLHPVEGRELTVGILSTGGDTFGWSALVEPRRYTASAVCLEDCRVLAIPGVELLSYLEKNPAIGFPVMRRLAGIISSRLQETRSHLQGLMVPGKIEGG